MRYCPNCKKNVETEKKFNWLAFLLLLFLGGIGGILYVLYYLILKRPRCRNCGVEL